MDNTMAASAYPISQANWARALCNCRQESFAAAGKQAERTFFAAQAAARCKLLSNLSASTGTLTSGRAGTLEWTHRLLARGDP